MNLGNGTVDLQSRDDSASTPSRASRAEGSPQENGQTGAVDLTYFHFRERLEVHRVQRSNGNLVFAFVGAVNLLTGVEYRPFLYTLSVAERKWAEELIERKADEYKSKEVTDVEQLTTELSKLADNINEGSVSITDEQEMRLTFVWQRIRHTLKKVKPTH